MSGPLTGERTAPGIPSENYWYRRHVAAYLFAARLARGRVVDAGSGEGYGAALLARRAAAVVALDLDPSTTGHLAASYPSVLTARADLCHLPVASGSVDAVVALQVIEHLHCAEGFLAAVRRALRPGGLLVLSTPNRATFPAGLNPYHVREYEAEELEALCDTAFPRAHLLGLVHRAPLRALERFLGEPVQRRLVRSPWAELPAWLRLVLRSVTSRDFRVTAAPRSALDLIAVCPVGRGTIEG